MSNSWCIMTPNTTQAIVTVGACVSRSKGFCSMKLRIEIATNTHTHTHAHTHTRTQTAQPLNNNNNNNNNNNIIVLESLTFLAYS